ncbi:hypothetical protein LPJ66_007833 [Kickxella alabastrina]|uniref:Uncharacterized protein n=1 Tax=Kickxella alabastrina TaxID=61397 RepID=A0ACC1I7S8_9FUNG|nr:hypothetical protein LPJ66_007833 [Kickxella alabastrina]
MRAFTLHRLFVTVALALFCLASISSAQNDEDTSSTPTPTRSPTRTSNTEPAESSATRKDESDVASDKNDESDLDNEVSDDPEPTNHNDDDNNPTQSFDESYDVTGIVGAFSWKTPDVISIPTPMFVIGEKITLGWTYTNETLRPPAKVSICGKFPSDSGKSTSRAAICDWTIAVNISGEGKKFIWDTVTDGAKGIAFSEDTGYKLYIYDSERDVSDNSPGAGRVIPLMFWFNMYNSRYNMTNQGVPVGYDPSAAPNIAVHLWTVLGAVVLGVLGMLV